MNPQAEALRASGYQAMQAGNLDQAAQYFQQAAGYEPDNYDTYAYLGAVYAKQNNFESARRAFGKGVQLQPSNSRARFNLGVAHERAGDIEAARTCYDSALDLDHNNQQAKQALKKLPAKEVKMHELSGFGSIHLAGAHAEAIEDNSEKEEFHASSLTPQQIAALSMGTTKIHLAGAHAETIGDEELHAEAAVLTQAEVAALSAPAGHLHMMGAQAADDSN